MYDSVDVAQIPANAAMLAGYVDGHWPTAQLLPKRFPRARVVTITVLGTNKAHVVDIEKGDCTPQSGVACIKRGTAHSPYCNLSQLGDVLRQIDAQGLPRSTPIWTAHWTKQPHICSAPCFAGFDLPWTPHVVATQYDDRALGRNLDASLTVNYWPGVDPTPVPVFTYRRMLRLGMFGRDVISLKRRMRYLGYRGLWYTPYFGRGLDRVVREFQHAHKLLVDGIVGPITAKAVNQ
jgi:hypothetical protein